MSLAHHTESGEPLLHNENPIEGQGLVVDENNLKRDRFVVCNDKASKNEEAFVT